MRLFLVLDGKRVPIKTPFLGADHAEGQCGCPLCSSAPIKVAGTGRRFSADDRAHEADAVCCACGQHVGIIRAEPNTLFGVREDAAVAKMGVRIY